MLFHTFVIITVQQNNENQDGTQCYPSPLYIIICRLVMFSVFLVTPLGTTLLPIEQKLTRSFPLVQTIL